MGTWVTSNTPLPTPKVDAHPPVIPEQEIDAVDVNNLWGAAADLRDHTSGWINAKAWGAKGDGVTDDTTALRAALAQTGAAKPVLFIPAGTYLTDTLTLPSYSRIIGSGWNNTSLRPLNNNNSVLLIDRNGPGTTGYMVGVSGLLILGNSTGTGHGIEVTSQNNGAMGLRIRDVYVLNMGGDGLHLDTLWTSRLDNVHSGGSLGDQFWINNAINSVALHSCYAHAVPTAGKAGYRVLQGRITLINCNGIDTGANLSAHWGVFGSQVSLGDAITASARTSILGCNVEDFTGTGVWIKNGSQFEIQNTSFGGAATGVNMKAVMVSNGSVGPLSYWSPTNTVSLKAGGTWANSAPLHSNQAPVFFTAGQGGLATMWADDAGFSVSLPFIGGVGQSTGTVLLAPFYLTSTTGPKIMFGSAPPAVDAALGTLFLNTAGGTLTTLYVKTATGAGGWTAK